MSDTTANATKLKYEELTEQILGAAIEVHKALGPGLLESAYEECLCHELNLRGLRFERQITVPVLYKGISLDCGYKLDIIVEDTVILELKSVERITSIHEAQLLTYMKLMKQACRFHHQFQCCCVAERHCQESFVTCLLPCLRASVVNKLLAHQRPSGDHPSC